MQALRPIVLLVIVAILASGCCFHKDLTQSAQVQASGTLRRSFDTSKQLDLFKDTHTCVLFLADQDYTTSSRDERVGVLEAGTRLRVNRVERVKELIAILVFLPEYYSWDCTLARIEDGHFAGKEVAVDGGVMRYKKGVATIGGQMLVSAKAEEANKALQPTATAPPVLTQP